jgi:hypothetical protein
LTDDRLGTRAKLGAAAQELAFFALPAEVNSAISDRFQLWHERVQVVFA